MNTVQTCVVGGAGSATDLAARVGGDLLRLCGDAFDRRLDAEGSKPIAVAFSGGGDSLALLLAARAWAAAAGRPILALTLDHRLQAQSRAWTAAAERTALGLGVHFEALAWTSAKPATGVPAAARRARHALLALAARRAGARVILLGHTRDDVLESEIMRSEGSTLGRLAEWSPSPAWPEGHSLFLFRPLLGLRRMRLRKVLGDGELDWIEDPANEDPRFARSRARQSLRRRPRSDAGADGSQHPDTSVLAAGCSVDAFGVVGIERAALAAAAPAAQRQVLAAGCVCAGGGDRLPRGDRIERLRSRIAAGEVFVASLSGARIEAGDSVRLFRDAGEFKRRGLMPQSLAPGEPMMWDGRFELLTDREGLKVRPLAGVAARLPRVEREALKEVAAPARPGLPALLHEGGGLTCPILASDPEVRVRCAVGRRLASVCGLVVREDQLWSLANGEADQGALS